jgi:hypothetical protein
MLVNYVENRTLRLIYTHTKVGRANKVLKNSKRFSPSNLRLQLSNDIPAQGNLGS